MAKATTGETDWLGEAGRWGIVRARIATKTTNPPNRRHKTLPMMAITAEAVMPPERLTRVLSSGADYISSKSKEHYLPADWQRKSIHAAEPG